MKIFLLAVLVLTQFKAQSQNQLDSLINSSIESILIETADFYKTAWKGRKNVKEDFCIYRYNFRSNFEFSEAVLAFNPKILFFDDLREEDQIKGVYGLYFVDAELNGCQIEIIFNQRGYKLEGHRNMIGVSQDIYKFTYQYNCDSGQWELKERYPNLKE